VESKSLAPGARNAVVCCLAIGSKDRVVILTDFLTATIASALEVQVREVGAAVSRISIEDHGPRPMSSLPESLRLQLRQFAPSVSILAASGQPGEVPFRFELVDLLIHELRVRHAHMCGVDERLMTQGMRADYAVVSNLVRRITEVVRSAKTLAVNNAQGTELRVTLSPELRWQPCSGLYHEPGQWGNPPEGETFTCPADVEGVAVCEVLGDHFSEEYGVLRHPVRFEIHGSRVRRVVCDDAELRRKVECYLAIDPNGSRVGEFALGANMWVSELSGNLLQDEKIPGVHLAFGSPIPWETGADWDAATHLDVIPSKPTVWVDDRLIMRAGRYEAELLEGISGLPGV
jgi:leucyl aminopeptidase (aminopeptidase T)